MLVDKRFINMEQCISILASDRCNYTVKCFFDLDLFDVSYYKSSLIPNEGLNWMLGQSYCLLNLHHVRTTLKNSLKLTRYVLSFELECFESIENSFARFESGRQN